MRLLVTGGGTGGHVYPALSVLERLGGDVELLWLCKRGGIEVPLLERAGIPHATISAGGMAELSWRERLVNAARLARGFGAAWGWLGRFRPDVIFATGGYVTFPVGLAGWLRRIPIVIYLPDVVPGLAVRALSPLARRVAVTTPETARIFGGKGVVTGYPVRRALASPKSRAAAREALGLPADEKVLLVTGGSQGSHTLNEAVGMFLQDFLEAAIVIHVHGLSDGEWLRAQRAVLPERLRERYRLHDYLHEEMSDALLAADLVVARAGASVLGEFSAAALPAILVPLPAAGVHQRPNARWVAEQGGALILDDDRARSGLLPMVRRLLADPARLEAMRQAMRDAAHPDAAERIARLLGEVAARRQGVGAARRIR